MNTCKTIITISVSLAVGAMMYHIYLDVQDFKTNTARQLDYLHHAMNDECYGWTATKDGGYAYEMPYTQLCIEHYNAQIAVVSTLEHN